MAASDRFEGLAIFLAAARHCNFRRAAVDVGVTPSAVSHAIRALEARVGLPLFVRTTRAAALTDAGRVLLTRLTTADDALREGFAEIESMRGRPNGLVRLTVPRLAVPLFVTPMILALRDRHPELALEISVDDAHVDLTTAGFDAGIRIGESIPHDMLGVRLSPRIQWCIVSAPSYFERHGEPNDPSELADHVTIGYRRAGTNAIYRWEMVRGRKPYVLDVTSAITVNDGKLALTLARKGAGLVYTADVYIQDDLESGALVRVLDEHMPQSPGFFLYCARGAQRQPKVRAVIEAARRVAIPRR